MLDPHYFTESGIESLAPSQQMVFKAKLAIVSNYLKIISSRADETSCPDRHQRKKMDPHATLVFSPNLQQNNFIFFLIL